MTREPYLYEGQVAFVRYHDEETGAIGPTVLGEHHVDEAGNSFWSLFGDSFEYPAELIEVIAIAHLGMGLPWGG